MTEKKHTPSYTVEFGARGVRIFHEHRSDYGSDNAAYRAIASKLGAGHPLIVNVLWIRHCIGINRHQLQTRNGIQHGIHKRIVHVIFHGVGRATTDFSH